MPAKKTATTAKLPSVRQAELVMWRVFGVRDVIDDRPLPGWTTAAVAGSGNTDRVEVGVGDIPDDLRTTLRTWRAQLNGDLDRRFGGISNAERLRRYKRDLDEITTIREFDDDPYPLWLWVRHARPISISPKRGAILDWVTESDGPRIRAAFEAFKRDGGPYLDAVVALTLAAARDFNVTHVRFNDPRPYLVLAGRPAITEAQLQMSIRDTGVTTTGRSWQSAPTDALTAVLATLPAGQRVGVNSAGAARWLCSALAEESDDLRRFVFAFGGLELLVTKAEKALRRDLIQHVEEADPELPLQELLWPGTTDDFVVRNLVFRFSAMAAVLSSPTARADLVTFKELVNIRNSIFHGRENAVDKGASVSAQELLRRYLGLLAAWDVATAAAPSP